jgi:hypothetical protein
MGLQIGENFKGSRLGGVHLTQILDLQGVDLQVRGCEARNGRQEPI